MTKANELVDARINFISFVKKGANGDPLRILKSDDGQGLDLAALNKAEDDVINVPVTIPKNDGKPAVEAPVIADEVIQKLNLMNIARQARSVSRNLRQGTNAGYRYARNPTGHRNLGTAVGHLIRSRAGAVGVTAGVTAGRVVIAAGNRVARARAVGKRVGTGLRAGYGLSRAVSAAGRRGVGPNSPAAQAFMAAHRLGSRRSLAVGARAGIAQAHVESGVRAGRVWVHNARVAGGGFWRRVSGH